MPELPEVETIMTLVKHRISNQSIRKIKVLNRNLRWPIETEKIRKLEGYRVKSIYRRGKYIIITFISTNLQLVLHLGMTGVISFKNIAEYSKNKHDHFLIYFDNFLMIFNDIRKFGSIHLTDDLSSLFLINNLGIEPLSKRFSGEYMYTLSRNKSCTIKDFIMNQKIVVGIGNIYATESLFMAGIFPGKASGSISKKKYHLLATNIKKVLRKAIKSGGTSIRNYKDTDGNPGYFAQKLLVYQKKYCSIHKSTLISNLKISGRSSFFCSKCQK